VKIAIFGGSFDPPHIGHESIVTQALKELEIDKLVVVPTFLNPFKQNSFLNAKTRLILLQKLFKHNDKIKVSNFEILKDRAVYSIETVKYLKKLYNTDKIYLIIGTDNLKDLHLWNAIEELKTLVTFVVATRSGYLNENYGKIETLNVNVKISSTKLRGTLDLDFIPNIIKEDVKQLWQKT